MSARNAVRPMQRVALPAVVLLAACASSHAPDDARKASLLDAIDAERIVAIADADHLASTYADQVLAPADSASRDALVVWSPRSKTVPPVLADAPNSVTSPPEVLALSPDSDTAYVVERLGQRGPGITTVPQLPRGGRLTAIDLRDAARPRMAATLDLGQSPEALDLRADGRMLAVVSNTAQASRVQLVAVDGARLGRVHVFDLADLGVTGDSQGPRGSVTASAVAWHPSGKAIAVNLNTRDGIAFFRVAAGRDGAPTLHAWGAPLRVGRDPFTGRFTPDGRHYLSLDWGRDFAAKTLDGRLPRAPSRISVVRLADRDDAHGAHAVVGSAPTDRSSEGIAVSPDGRLVATVNMRETVLPADSPRHTREASISLLAFDPSSGALRPLGNTLFEGVLPEGASFDRSGRHLLVSVYEYRGAAGGGLEVFRIDRKAGGARATRLGRIAAPRGVHHVVVGR